MHYNLVKASNRRYLEELKNRGHEMKPVYDAVNIMQETEWVINLVLAYALASNPFPPVIVMIGSVM